jgi:glycosyltransferase involved in cell wall biosynthesis
LQKISAVIPAYNEARFIADVISRAKKHVDHVVVVDDGSTDETAEIAAKNGAILIVHERNMGKWIALRDGFKKALEISSDLIVQLDGDGQHDPDEIPKFIDALKEFDVVVGYRSKKGMPLIRRFSNFITTAMLRMFFSLNISDSQCGYRAYRREALAKLMNVEAKGFEGETASLILAKRLGLRIGEVQIKTIYGQEKSKMKVVRDTYRFLKTVFSMKVKAIKGEI